MKRAISLFTLVLALTFAPMSLTLVPVSGGNTQVGVTTNVARAAQECVELSVQIIKGQNNICGDDAKGGVIVAYLREFLKYLFGLVTAVIILMMVISGIQYITSAGAPDAIKSAKKRLTNAIIALVLFLSAYAILGFIIPGGII